MAGVRDFPLLPLDSCLSFAEWSHCMACTQMLYASTAGSIDWAMRCQLWWMFGDGEDSEDSDSDESKVVAVVSDRSVEDSAMNGKM